MGRILPSLINSLARASLWRWVRRRLSVPSTRPLAVQIEDLLPQTQCHQCGYPGCKPYAEAIATEEAPINLCQPGGDFVVKELAALLNKPYQKPAKKAEKPMVAFIREEACIGCTLCIQACPVACIVGAPKQVHTVITEECTGCTLCIPPCPVDCIDMEMLPQAPLPAYGVKDFLAELPEHGAITPVVTGAPEEMPLPEFLVYPMINKFNNKMQCTVNEGDFICSGGEIAACSESGAGRYAAAAGRVMKVAPYPNPYGRESAVESVVVHVNKQIDVRDSCYSTLIMKKPHYIRITVSGGGVSTPRNVMVPLGALVADVLAFCGYDESSTARLHVGHPLTGYAVHDVRTPIVETMFAITALTQQELIAHQEQLCLMSGEYVSPTKSSAWRFVTRLLRESYQKSRASYIGSLVRAREVRQMARRQARLRGQVITDAPKKIDAEAMDKVNLARVNARLRYSK